MAYYGVLRHIMVHLWKHFVYLAIVYREYFFSFLEVVYNPNEYYCLGSIEVKTAKLHCIKKRFLKRFDAGEIVHMKMEYIILFDRIEQKI